MEANGASGCRRNIGTPVRAISRQKQPSHIEIGQHGAVRGMRRQAETGYASSRPFVTPHVTRVSNKEWKAQVITALPKGGRYADLSTYFGAGTIRPNVLPGCDKSVGGSIVRSVIGGNSVVNAACFADPGLFSLGDESRFDPTLRAQGINNWDFSASKLTSVTERVSVDFRAEFFNLFNRVQFAPPNTSFGGASFGLITSQANNPCQIEFSLRASF
jgi:hypothetical protein